MNLPVTQKHFLSFSRKLFLSVISLFLVFAICFIAYQYQREREYKIELLNTKLQDYNSRLYEQLEEQPLDSEIISGYINKHILEVAPKRNIPVTINCIIVFFFIFSVFRI